MKKTVVLVLLLVLIVTVGVSAQTLKGMSLNGATGLISIPSGRIGWEHSADFGFDLGYHAIIDDDQTAHIPKVSGSLFKTLELGFAYDSQADSDNADMLFSGKFQLPIEKASAIAVGGNIQQLEQGGTSTNITQIYLAATYPGDFFTMPAETTFVIGKSFGDNAVDENIDFGMGFDLMLLPDVFQGYVHWINDFANFSYSNQAIGAIAGSRGVFNTGMRIDLGSAEMFRGFKFVIDAILTDALDANRAFALGLTFGASLK
ncbi:MAG: hypothetical protein ACP5IA_10780 [Sediminispirochaetaceae bacterium]